MSNDLATYEKFCEDNSEGFAKLGTTKVELLSAFQKAPPSMRKDMLATARKFAESDTPTAPAQSKEAGIRLFLQHFYQNVRGLLEPSVDENRFVAAGMQTANDMQGQVNV